MVDERMFSGSNDQEFRLQRFKLDAALAFVRANEIDRLVIDSDRPRFGIVTTGKAHLDTLQALEDLGIDARRASELGIKLYKVGMNWPLVKSSSVGLSPSRPLMRISPGRTGMR